MISISLLGKRILKLKREFDNLKQEKESLLMLIDEAEIPESVYNSNAIENSTLSLKETENILFEQKVSRNVSVREVFEAKNLARLMEYIRDNILRQELDIKLLLYLHNILLSGINDKIAGRFRTKGEYVRVGKHIAPAPEHIERMTEALFDKYFKDNKNFSIDKIAQFHAEFETIHPFVDGNGRIGRIMINYQLQRLGYPVIIIRDKDKKNYYQALAEYQRQVSIKNLKKIEKIISLSVIESLHKRIAYLKGHNIISIIDYAKQQDKSASSILNAAKRQTLAAFRENGVWKISE